MKRMQLPTLSSNDTNEIGKKKLFSCSYVFKEIRKTFFQKNCTLENVFLNIFKGQN
jgi:hypothetical protein